LLKPTLRGFYFENKFIDDNLFKEYPKHLNHEILEYLELKTFDKNMYELVKRCKNLKELRLIHYYSGDQVIIESYIIDILDSLPSLRTVALNCYTKQTLAKVKKLRHITDVKLVLQNSGDTWWITAKDVEELLVCRKSLKIIGTKGVHLEGHDIPRIK